MQIGNSSRVKLRSLFDASPSQLCDSGSPFPRRRARPSGHMRPQAHARGRLRGGIALLGEHVIPQVTQGIVCKKTSAQNNSQLTILCFTKAN